ncbi:LuxR C-terminal-related transcriptional regulator [Nocardia cyriacigeorgica]|uniref:LuxR C-terminal-related transcriptional regulator n=1 Tax=Nocardia cyriacigeorgica TaxID=135487 RepID=UPI0024579FBC|nr:LuxR C-terminal-related transcriptional regulator [Nocardia cyriacigeorgica]
MSASQSISPGAVNSRAVAVGGRAGRGVPTLPFPPIRLTPAIDALDRACDDSKVTLVCAPAGSGKTALVVAWLEDRLRRDATLEVGWVTVTEQMDDPEALWAAVRTSLDLPAAPLATGAIGTPTAHAAALVEELGTRSAPVVLVIDDAHLLTDPLNLAGMEYLVAHAPPMSTLVVVGRFDPPLRWHPVALTGRLVRLGAADLVFGDRQIAQLCAQHEIGLTDVEIETVERLTGGWAALVRIAAIYLTGHADDRDGALSALARTPHAVADFLVGEVFDLLPPQTLDFVIGTAVPIAFTAEMADELCGMDTAGILEDLARMNFPIHHRSRDGDLWYSYHPMVRTYLLAESRRRDPQQVAGLHARAARALLAAGRPLDALPHLLAEPGRPQVARFLRDHGPRVVFGGEGAVLFQLLGHERGFDDDPFLWLLRAVDAVSRADSVEAGAYLGLLTARGVGESAIVPHTWLRPLASAVAVDAHIADHDAGPAPDPSQLRMEAVTGHIDLDCFIVLQAATDRTRRGDVRDGEAGILHALALAEHAGLPRLQILAVVRLAMSAGLSGSIVAMRERAMRAVALAEKYSLAELPDVVQARVMVAGAAYLRGEPSPFLGTEPAGRRNYREALVPTAIWRERLVFGLAAFDSADDRHLAAEELDRAAHQLLDQTHPVEATGRILVHVVWVQLKLHAKDAARRLIEHGRSALGSTPEMAVVAAALAESQHKPASTISLLEPVLADAQSLQTSTAVTAWLLCASACHQLDRPAKEYEALDKALAAAAPDQIIRPFLDVPGALELLAANAGRFGHGDALVQIIRAHPSARRSAGAPHLTETELTVLRQLPSGRTSQNVARDMGVSINTVKTHLRGIYQKLGTTSRADAIAQARQLGLL